MGRPKKKAVGMVEMTEKVYRLWYIDYTDSKVKHVQEYAIKKLVGYDSDLHCVVTEDGKWFHVYATFREASIVMLGALVFDKKEKWQKLVDDSMIMNKEISDLLDQLDKLRKDGDD